MTDIKDDWKKWFVALNYISGENVVRTSEDGDAYNTLYRGLIKINAIQGKHELDKEFEDEIKKNYKLFINKIKEVFNSTFDSRIVYHTMVYQILLGNAFYIRDGQGKPKKIRITEYCKKFGCCRELFYRYPYKRHYYTDNDNIGIIARKKQIFELIEKTILDTEKQRIVKSMTGC